MGKRTDELIYEHLEEQIDGRMIFGATSQQSQQWKDGYLAGMHGAKKVIKEFFIEDEE